MYNNLDIELYSFGSVKVREIVMVSKCVLKWEQFVTTILLIPPLYLRITPDLGYAYEPL